MWNRFNWLRIVTRWWSLVNINRRQFFDCLSDYQLRGQFFKEIYSMHSALPCHKNKGMLFYLCKYWRRFDRVSGAWTLNKVNGERNSKTNVEHKGMLTPCLEEWAGREVKCRLPSFKRECWKRRTVPEWWVNLHLHFRLLTRTQQHKNYTDCDFTCYSTREWNVVFSSWGRPASGYLIIMSEYNIWILKPCMPCSVEYLSKICTIMHTNKAVYTLNFTSCKTSFDFKRSSPVAKF